MESRNKLCFISQIDNHFRKFKSPKMGPKKKDKVVEAVVDPEWLALKTDADRLFKLTQKEERDFNEFQQQREKLNYFWIVEKRKLEDKRSELRNKDRELQDLEEKHQVEIKIYKQRLKHLLHEHQDEISQKKTEAEMATKIAQDDDRESEFDIKSDKRNLDIAFKETLMAHEEYIRGLKREQDQRITFLRHEFERKANEIQKSYEMRMKKTREVLDKRRKEEVKAIEDKKSEMIEAMLVEHQKAFTDIKNYYNDITHNNLDLIKSLKEEVKQQEADEKKDELKLHEKMLENKKLSAPLKKMQEDVLRLSGELEEYNKEKNEMRRVKSALHVLEHQSTSFSWEHETLLQRFSDLRVERDQLKSNLLASMFDVKQKSGFKGLLLEKKLTAVQRVQEEREAQLNEVLTRANLEPAVLGQIKGQVDDVIQRKNSEIRKFQTEVARLSALQEQLSTSVRSKLSEFGLTIHELGFDPASAK
jgi:growth arrest-specific protein 8